MKKEISCVKCGTTFTREIEDAMEGEWESALRPWCPTCEAKVTAAFQASDEYKKLYDRHGNPREPLLKKLAKKLMLPGSYS